MSSADGSRAGARSGRATIKDVARLSGVSTATVTRALQGHPRVLPATRQRVESSASKLGYRPDRLARTLVTGVSHTIGLVIPSSGDAFWGEVVEGLEQSAVDAGFSLVLGLAHGDPDRERRMLEVLIEKRVDGIVVAAPAGRPHEWEGFGGSEVPLVLVACDATAQPDELDRAAHGPVHEAIASLATSAVGGAWFAHITSDDIGGSAAAVRHLVELGHERIALLAGPALRPALLRLLGFRLALEEAGLSPAAILTSAESFEAGVAMARELLSSPDPPSAIVAYNDIVAIGAIRGARALGLRVPDDVSIVGFDDIEFATYVDPPLTTLRWPKREMGRLAMELLLQGLDGLAGQVTETLAGELVLRSSTAAPTSAPPGP
jgi:DNA-binding LacI/PurR family transcriptional regulator